MKIKRIVAVALTLITLLSTFAIFGSLNISAETGYGRGYNQTMAGTGKVVSKGLDISEHQKGINIQRIKDAGFSYVILRIGIRLAADNTIRKDYQFETFYQGARNAGLHIGGYFYSRAKSEAEAIEEANKVIEYTKGKKFEYPIYLDFEDGDTWPTRNSTNADKATKICYAFMNTLRDAGYLVGLYGYASWFDDGYSGWMSSKLNNDIGKKYEFWMANYFNNNLPENTRTKNYPTKYGMYQYSSKLTISGWSGVLDHNVCYKNYPSIVSQYGFNGYAVGEKIEAVPELGKATTKPNNSSSSNNNNNNNSVTEKPTDATEPVIESGSESATAMVEVDNGCKASIGVGATLIALASVGGAALFLRKRED
ncbi:MAG: hypothetical protein J6U68_02400 [Clostridia bacterium]|nr:hypothetical protein [Clostridia bacterium]